MSALVSAYSCSQLRAINIEMELVDITLRSFSAVAPLARGFLGFAWICLSFVLVFSMSDYAFITSTLNCTMITCFVFQVLRNKLILLLKSVVGCTRGA